ncbi:MAG: SUMF1/EgtB/PvdO family nonheme iron enzyme [Ardenticatenaceae bacterium]|nr:SUMF1/EgtB/PvdO family nonheme iron enzyme [Ardenticatenaceae bacterium]MCB9443610.1 SUMF1/EgtB/PvdO family nonheme iron enzyme [Ardenticatenaceae bacterium]
MMSQLLQLLTTHFNRDELKTLCHELGVNFDELPEGGISGQARELIHLLRRQERLADLIEWGRRLRPKAAWPTAAEATADYEPIAAEPELRPYLELILRRSSRLPLVPLDPQGRESAHLSLRQVFINLNGDFAYQVRRDETNTAYKEHLFFNAILAHIHANQQLILLGDPGSGKSTLLRYLAHILAQHWLEPGGNWLENLAWPVGVKQFQAEESEIVYSRESHLEKHFEADELQEQQWVLTPPVPIYIELREFARSQFDPDSPLALWDYAGGQLERDGLASALPALQRLLEQGRIIFLLDGVDEVPVPERGRIWRAVANLANGVGGSSRWVTTCRVLSFTAAEAPAGVPVKTLRALDEAQIEAFIGRWYGALAGLGEMNQEKADNMAASLQTAAQRPQLQPLAENPMLLTIMAIVQTFYGTLPDERAKLYQACVEALLLRWQRHKEQDAQSELPSELAELAISQEDLERLLWEIAWQAHKENIDGDEGADIAETDLMAIARQHLGSWAKAEQFLAYTERRAHLLVGKGGVTDRVYTFPHRTFQEYLAACYLTPGLKLRKLGPELAAQGDTWREVLNLAAGVLVHNKNNREMVILAMERILPKRTPAADDEAGWYRVWRAAEMGLIVGRENLADNEVAEELLPELQTQLAALLETGALTPVQRAEAGAALGWLGDPRAGVCTLEPVLIAIEDGLTFGMGKNYEPVTIPAPYQIAQYPVTHAQFRFFVADGGYTDKWRHCWTKDGWRYKERDGWTEPRYWNDPQFNSPNQPVVGISWYEAAAYAHWLAEKTGKNYRLPTEAEWERAARHTDNRIYPWGNDWRDGIVNSTEAGIGRPTAVGGFPAGAAEGGIQDMSGNVWEWCQDKVEWGHRLKGGSFWQDKDSVSAAARLRNLPDLRHFLARGVRVVVSPFISGL